MSDPGPSSRPDKGKYSPEREESDPKRIKASGTGRSNLNPSDEYREKTIPASLIGKELSAPINPSTGVHMKVISNFVRWHTPKDRLVQCYRVEFDPPIESVRIKRRLIYHVREIFGGAYLFDGGNDLKSYRSLDGERTSANAPDPQGNNVSLTFEKTATIAWGHPEMFRLYNTQMRRNLQSLGFLQMGRYLFDRMRREPIQGDYQVELWPGIATAINEHQAGILMVFDKIHKVVRKDTVYRLLTQIYNSDITERKTEFRNRAREIIPKEIVLATHSNRTYRVDDIDFSLNPGTCKFNHKGREISLLDYMSEIHGVTISDQKQPLLVVRPTARQVRGGQEGNIYLVPEKCIMTGMPIELLKDQRVKASIASVTQQDPQPRLNALKDFLERFHSSERIRNDMQAWSLRMDRNLLEVPCRKLPWERICTADRQEDEEPYSTGGQFGDSRINFDDILRRQKPREVGNFGRWAVMSVRSQEGRRIADKFLHDLRKVCNGFNVELSSPILCGLDNERTSDFVSALNTLESNVKLVVILVPNNNKERYDAIKKACCLTKGKLSQIVTRKVLLNPQGYLTIVTKIAIQMLVKVGGVAWAINIPPSNLMVVGFDVYHDTAHRGKSVGAFVSSYNKDLTKYYSRVSFHESGEELSTNFASFFAQGLKKYYEVNQKLPARIVVYRDGVSEGQIRHVYEVELGRMKAAIDSVLNESKSESVIKWTFIIVTKRIRARFFLEKNKKIINPHRGTVVDRDVTRKERFDFYLISQSVRRGTVCPTMYNVIEDTTGWEPQHQQHLAYKLCYLYFNWAGLVSVPAPCQYAHKLAYLTGTSLHEEAHDRLRPLLFYL